MDRSLYVAMSGARQVMQAQSINTHNLANANTTGFRADLLMFTDKEAQGPGFPSRVYSALQGNGVNLATGATITTGRSLDLAVQGEGLIAVQSSSGQEAYTRAGNMRISPNGMLVTGGGWPVMGNDGGPIAIPPAEKVEIGSDGTISVLPIGQQATALVVVDRIKLVNPDKTGLVKNDDGLLYSTLEEVAVPDAAVKVVSGVLESSNVNAVEAMVNMISLSRLFEMEVKMMSNAQDNDRAATELLSIA